ncbi:MAG: arylamine N-acetyltransferase [Pirellulales bacterium]
MTAFDLDGYFRRIGYAGSRQPTQETLFAIHAAHATTIPFENLNPVLRWPVKLDLPSLETKIVQEGRGGWCYEHNLLLSHVLRSLGFEVTWLAARVLWNAPEGTLPPRSHMLMQVVIEGTPYLVDVGFGGMTLTTPLLLEADKEQSTTLEPFRLVRHGNDFLKQAKIRDDWKTLYRFDLQEQQLSDYEVSNWYLSHFPDCFLIHELLLARPDHGRRFMLRNNSLAIHSITGESEKRQLTTASQLREVLERDFRLRLPHSPEVQAMLEKYAALPPPEEK